MLSIVNYLSVEEFVDLTPKLSVSNEKLFVHVDNEILGLSAIDALISFFAFTKDSQSKHTN